MTSTTRGRRALRTGRPGRLRLSAACLVVAAALGWTAVAAPAEVVMVEDGRLTVDVRDAEVAEVLHQVAEAAGFHLTTTGELGRVTASFSARTVEGGLRRLVQDHEMMLVYRPAAVSGGPATLVEVQVFASAAVRGSGTAPGPRDGAGGAEAIAEITRFVRARDAERGVPRLAELLATSPDPGVRGRAVWGLSVLGGPVATQALSTALRDAVPLVRGQAAQALRRTAGAEAIPALSGLLASDPDASVRRAAARALAALRSPAADAALIAGANDEDALVRVEAQRALDRLSEPSR